MRVGHQSTELVDIVRLEGGDEIANTLVLGDHVTGSALQSRVGEGLGVHRVILDLEIWHVE